MVFQIEGKARISSVKMKACCRKTIETPEVRDFWKAVAVEASYQRMRWNSTDPTKEDADWYWLLGWLGGKAIHNPRDAGDPRTDLERKLHRIVTVAAAAYNWHAAVKEKAGLDGQAALASLEENPKRKSRRAP